MKRIAVIDYGMGNLRSVTKALEQVAPAAEVLLTDQPQVILDATHVVFPGQGAMPDCMKELEKRKLAPAIIESAKYKPFLGICIGEQLLFEQSEEGNTKGLGILTGEVIRFKHPNNGANQPKLKIPHMGWNQVIQTRPHPIWHNIPNDERFYFVHSYYVALRDQALAIGSTDYILTFTSAISHANIVAVQFHPEKSHTMGLRLLANFAKWDGKN